MRVFNRVVAVVLILVALPVSTLFLVMPDAITATLADASADLEARVADFGRPVRLGMVLVAVVVDLALFLLLFLELRRKPEPGGRVARVRGVEGEVSLEAIHQRVHHHVTHQVNAESNSLNRQVINCSLAGTKQQIRQVVCYHAIDLFRHGAVEATQARFHVGDRDLKFGRCQCSSQGGIGVPIDQHLVGPFIQQHFFDAG